MTDAELLEKYVRGRSHEAFAELVRRHVDWVNSAALRLVKDSQRAEDVTQAVFIVLARKAGSISRFPLNAWLFKVTRYACRNANRGDARRLFHERSAAGMKQEASAADPHEAWTEIAPIVDEMVGRLGAADREAILLRFYQQKKMSDVGLALGVTEDNARKRVARALERLRALLRDSGVMVPATILGTSLTLLVTRSASAQGMNQCIALSAHGASSGSASLIAKGALKTMIHAKLKMAAVFTLVFAGVPIAGVGTYLLRADTAATPMANATTQPTAPASDAGEQAQVPQGTWKMVDVKANGADATRDMGDATFVISATKMMVKGSLETEDATVTFKTAASPPSFDTVSQGQVAHGIYQRNGNDLTLCLTMPGGNRPDDFITKPGDNRMLIHLKWVSNSTTAPPASQPTAGASQYECASQLRQIGVAMIMYQAAHNGQLPPDFATLQVSMSLKPEDFICPSTGKQFPAGMTAEQTARWINQNSDFVYLGPKKVHGYPGDIVLAYEKEAADHDAKGINVLFLDAHVAFLSPVEARLKIARTKDMQN